MKYTITDCIGTESQFNSLHDVYQYIKSDISDVLIAASGDCLEDKKVDWDRLYADLQEFYDSGFSSEKTPWIREGDCWLSDLYTIYQEKQLL